MVPVIPHDRKSRQSLRVLTRQMPYQRGQLTSFAGDEGDVHFTLESLQGMKVASLKSLAVDLGLKSSGRKIELVNRILEHAAPNCGKALARSSRVIRSAKSQDEGKPKQIRRGSASKSLAEKPPKSHAQLLGLPSLSEYRETTEQTPETLSTSFFPFHPTHPAANLLFKNCVCNGAPSSWPGAVIACTRCGVKLHERCICWDSSAASEKMNENFLCPRCIMTEVDPFHPVYLHSGLPGASFLDFADGENGVLLSIERQIENGGLHEWRRMNKEVVVRCVKLGIPERVSKLIKHDWPRTLDLKVNENVESVLAPRPDHKRREAPMTITPYLKPDKSHLNIICSHPVKTDGTSDIFALGVFLCDTLDVTQLIKNVQRDCKETFDSCFARGNYTKRRIKFASHFMWLSGVADRYLSASGVILCPFSVRNLLNQAVIDDDVACVETNQRFRLACPITLMRMNIPVRGRHCTHLQCFDLEAFLRVTNSIKAFNNRWSCPECPCILRTNALVVDRFVEEILRIVSTSKAPDDAEALEINASGDWKFVKSQPTADHEHSSSDEEGLRLLQTQVKGQEHKGTDVWRSTNEFVVEDIASSDSTDDQEALPTLRHGSTFGRPHSSSPHVPEKDFSDMLHIGGENDSSRIVNAVMAWSNNRAKRRKVENGTSDLNPMNFVGSAINKSKQVVEETDSADNRNYSSSGLRPTERGKFGEQCQQESGFTGAKRSEVIDLSPSTCSSASVTEPEELASSEQRAKVRAISNIHKSSLRRQSRSIPDSDDSSDDERSVTTKHKKRKRLPSSEFGGIIESESLGTLNDNNSSHWNKDRCEDCNGMDKKKPRSEQAGSFVMQEKKFLSSPNIASGNCSSTDSLESTEEPDCIEKGNKEEFHLSAAHGALKPTIKCMSSSSSASTFDISAFNGTQSYSDYALTGDDRHFGTQTTLAPLLNYSESPGAVSKLDELDMYQNSLRMTEVRAFEKSMAYLEEEEFTPVIARKAEIHLHQPVLSRNYSEQQIIPPGHLWHDLKTKDVPNHMYYEKKESKLPRSESPFEPSRQGYVHGGLVSEQCQPSQIALDRFGDQCMYGLPNKGSSMVNLGALSAQSPRIKGQSTWDESRTTRKVSLQTQDEGRLADTDRWHVPDRQVYGNGFDDETNGNKSVAKYLKGLTDVNQERSPYFGTSTDSNRERALTKSMNDPSSFEGTLVDSERNALVDKILASPLSSLEKDSLAFISLPSVTERLRQHFMHIASEKALEALAVSDHEKSDLSNAPKIKLTEPQTRGKNLRKKQIARPVTMSEPLSKFPAEGFVECPYPLAASSVDNLQASSSLLWKSHQRCGQPHQITVMQPKHPQGCNDPSSHSAAESPIRHSCLSQHSDSPQNLHLQKARVNKVSRLSSSFDGGVCSLAPAIPSHYLPIELPSQVSPKSKLLPEEIIKIFDHPAHSASNRTVPFRGMKGQSKKAWCVSGGTNAIFEPLPAPPRPTEMPGSPSLNFSLHALDGPEISSPTEGRPNDESTIRVEQPINQFDEDRRFIPAAMRGAHNPNNSVSVKLAVTKGCRAHGPSLSRCQHSRPYDTLPLPGPSFEMSERLSEYDDVQEFVRAVADTADFRQFVEGLAQKTKPKLEDSHTIQRENSVLDDFGINLEEESMKAATSILSTLESRGATLSTVWHSNMQEAERKKPHTFMQQVTPDNKGVACVNQATEKTFIKDVIDLNFPPFTKDNGVGQDNSKYRVQSCLSTKEPRGSLSLSISSLMDHVNITGAD